MGANWSRPFAPRTTSTRADGPATVKSLLPLGFEMIELRLQGVDTADLRVAKLLEQFQPVVEDDEFFGRVAHRRRRTWGTPPFTPDLVDPPIAIHPRRT
jgi:hypothetical protein